MAEIKHIKGHQDCNQGPVLYNASLNVEAERLATTAFTSPQHYGLDTPNTKATLKFKVNIIASHHIHHLYTPFILLQ
jgi:hypothetical protein